MFYLHLFAFRQFFLGAGLYHQSTEHRNAPYPMSLPCLRHPMSFAKLLYRLPRSHNPYHRIACDQIRLQWPLGFRWPQIVLRFPWPRQRLLEVYRSGFFPKFCRLPRWVCRFRNRSLRCGQCRWSFRPLPVTRLFCHWFLCSLRLFGPWIRLFSVSVRHVTILPAAAQRIWFLSPKVAGISHPSPICLLQIPLVRN